MAQKNLKPVNWEKFNPGDVMLGKRIKAKTMKGFSTTFKNDPRIVKISIMFYDDKSGSHYEMETFSRDFGEILKKIGKDDTDVPTPGTPVPKTADAKKTTKKGNKKEE